MEINTILNRIKTGDLCRCTDESYANGFWDYAFNNYSNSIGDTNGSSNAERVYCSLWEVVDYFKINKCKDCK